MPVVFDDYKDNLIDECKADFGNQIRSHFIALNVFTWIPWVALFIPIFNILYVSGVANIPGFVTADYYLNSMPAMDTAYDCLMRSGVEEFSQENLDTEYWFQKGYIEDYSVQFLANSKPTYQTAKAAEMIIFYEGMLDYYNLPLTLSETEFDFFAELFAAPPA